MTSPSYDSHAHEIDLHSPWMRRLAHSLVGDASQADDVVQDAWSKLGDRRVRPGYLAAVVRSVARQGQRTDRRRVWRERHVARAEALPSTAEIAARTEVARKVAEALEGLEEPYRTTLVLRYHDDLSAAEIARRARVPASTVRARLKRGLDRLRGQLDDREGGRASWVSALLPLTRTEAPVPSAVALSLSSLVAMKFALGALLAVAGLALVWTLVPGDEGNSSRGATPVEGAASALVEREAREANIEEGPSLARLEVGSGDPPPEEGGGVKPSPQEAAVLARAVDSAGNALRASWLTPRHGDGMRVEGNDEGQLALRLSLPELERLARPLGSSREVAIEVGATGYRTRHMRARLVEGEPTLQLGYVALLPGGVVEGTVVDEGGLALEGALVAFGDPIPAAPDDPAKALRGPSDLNPRFWSGGDPAPTTYSGPGGHFRIEGIAPGHGTAWARTETSLWAFSPPIGIRSGEEVVGIELVVREGSRSVIAGRVVDPEGRPVPGLELQFTKSAGSDGWWTQRTDGLGRFHFAPLDRAAQDISAASPSWEWSALEYIGAEPGTYDLELAFAGSDWLNVAVQDPGGSPVREGRVVGLPGEGPTDRPLSRSESPLDTGGHGRLRRPEGPLRLRVQAPGYRDAIVGPIDPATFPDPLLVTLEPIPALVGQVLDPGGNPVVGARVGLHQGAVGSPGVIPPGGKVSGESYHLTHQGWPGSGDPFVYQLQAEPVAQVTTDDSGHYRLPLPGVDPSSEEEVERVEKSSFAGFGLRSARDRVSTAKPGRPWYLHASLEGEATVTSGPHTLEPTGDHELDLRLPRSGSIQGHLVLENGLSPLGWSVHASDGLAEVASAAVAEDGAFRFEHLHAGGWQLRAFEPGRSFSGVGGRMRTDRVPEPDVVVRAGQVAEYEFVARARTSARLSGRLWVDGQPAGPWKVIVRTSTPQASITSHETTLDPDGRFELALAPELSTTLSFLSGNGKGQLAVTTHPTIRPGNNEWSFDFTTATLEGRLTEEQSSGWARNGPTYTSEQGEVTIKTWIEVEEGHFGPLRVASGPGILRAPPTDHRTSGAILAELDLTVGEERFLDQP